MKQARVIGSQLPSPVKLGLRLVAVLIATIAVSSCARTAPGQETPTAIVRAAEREGMVVVYSNSSISRPVIDGFRARFPAVSVDYRDYTSDQIERLIIEETEGGRGFGDIAWSSAMARQVKLINDGYAQTYRSHQAAQMPRWAVWRDQGFGVTAEPVVFAFNSRILTRADVPKSHGELLTRLRANPEDWRGKIAIHDPERSGVGLMYLSADTDIYSDGWALWDAVGASDPGGYLLAATVMEALTEGQHAFVYNMNESYAANWAMTRSPDIEYVVPTDYHLVVSRVVFIAREAPHPNAARLFLDYLMSPEGQAKLAESNLNPVVGDHARPIAEGGRPIRVSPALLANVDQGRVAYLLKRWRAAKAGGAATIDSLNGAHFGD